MISTGPSRITIGSSLCKRDDYEAYLNRSELRIQTRERNHIQQLRGPACDGHSTLAGEVAVQYAIAKEYEDLGEYERSFEHLQQRCATTARASPL